MCGITCAHLTERARLGFGRCGSGDKPWRKGPVSVTRIGVIYLPGAVLLLVYLTLPWRRYIMRVCDVDL